MPVSSGFSAVWRAWPHEAYSPRACGSEGHSMGRLCQATGTLTISSDRVGCGERREESHRVAIDAHYISAVLVTKMSPIDDC